MLYLLPAFKTPFVASLWPHTAGVLGFLCNSVQMPFLMFCSACLSGVLKKQLHFSNSDSSDTFERSPEARVHISLLTSAIVFPTVISNPTRLIASTENKVFCAFTHGGVEDTMLWPWFIEGVGSSTRVHSCLTVKHEDQLQTELSGMQAQPFHTALPNFDTTGYKAPWAPVALRFLSAQGSRVSIRDSRLKGFGISSPPMASTAPLEVAAAVSELSGGCFGATDSAVYLEGVEFINCVSGLEGGLHVYRGSLEIRDTKFIGCRSTYRGGALGIVGCGTLLHNAAFINNTVASSNELWSGNNTSAPSDVMGGGLFMASASVKAALLCPTVFSTTTLWCQFGPACWMLEEQSSSVSAGFRCLIAHLFTTELVVLHCWLVQVR